MPSLQMRSGASATISCPLKRIEPLRWGMSPMIDFIVVDLAGAVAADQGDDLARPHIEADAAQDLRVAVGGFEVADLKHGRGAPCVPR